MSSVYLCSGNWRLKHDSLSADSAVTLTEETVRDRGAREGKADAMTVTFSSSSSVNMGSSGLKLKSAIN